MTSKTDLKRFLGPALLGAFVVGALYLVTVVHAVGEPLLAVTILVIAALAAWLYTSRRTYAYRYLYPAIGAALIFVVFPMVYTMAIGFTNYGSRNLLDFPRATQYLLDQTYAGDASTYQFQVFPDGGRYRARLEDQEKGDAFVSAPFDMPGEAPVEARMAPQAEAGFTPGDPLDLADVIAHEDNLKKLTLVLPAGTRLGMTGLSEYAAMKPLYRKNPDGTLVNNQDGTVLKANFRTGFYETGAGDQVQPGFQAHIGWKNYARIFTDEKFSGPFLKIFVWTVLFAGLSVFLTCSLGMVLAVLLNWEALRFRSVYRLLLFLPYAVPGFISILVWKGLFNSNTGEINLILNGLFGIKPGWFSDPTLAKIMILIVNTWLGFPYMMVVSMGLIKAIPTDLYEASAVAGAGPLTNFFKITLPLIRRPLTPLLISSFAFNFNNFVLIFLLTGGRPDFTDITVPAGTTDILISYVYRLAFQDSGQQFGLGAAISTVIFLLVAVLTVIQIRFTKITEDEKR
ncbi:maltose ABC transporter permease MalF [Mesoterricola sediminis]|uniref:Maltose/maltodextrin transport system permease protein n=1 Tax=Mesoterricola sediminis TaxID=2927980 RepID=A0AA48KC98_9BACT|nr:maltose ABC transporter permease MalF [Mesoterricola sediminis]BDU75845.1 maltose ABC transporter permease MalF [Mesoterricola sediminis]